ncbi:indole-diterpene biosynthesis protein-like protein PaxU, partial [Amniculicola lignicola CBS 123094]
MDSAAMSPNFVPLNSFVSLYTPISPVKGQLVILATWMGSLDKHIAKYTEAYARLIPNARILLIKGTLEVMFTTYTAQRKAIRPALEPIQALLEECEYFANPAEPSTTPHILIQVLSNGGTNSFTQLLHAFKTKFGTPLPIVGMIIDSALAKGGWRQNHTALLQTLRFGLVSKVFIALPLINLSILALELSIAMGFQYRPEDVWRKTPMDESLLRYIGANGEGVEAKRLCYLVSKKDKNVPWVDTVSHAYLADNQGYEVQLFVWDDTPHCNHISKHADEYLAAIENMWGK